VSPRAARLRLGALAAGIGVLVAVVALTGELSAERVRDWVAPYGAAGPVVFVAVSAALTVALFPGPLLAGASGLLFGTALGTPVAIAAATVGGTLAFSISRWVARDAVQGMIGGRVAALSEWIGRRGFVAVLYARIAPAIPYHLVNYGAGLTPVGLGAFAAGTAVGVAPRAFAYAALGGSLDDLGSPEAIVAVTVLVVMAVAGALLLRRDLRRERAAAARPLGPGTGSSSPGARSAARR